MSASDGGSSRASADASRVGFLDEKRDSYHDEEPPRMATWVKARMPGKILINWSCVPLQYLFRYFLELTNLLLPSFLQPRRQLGSGQPDSLSPTAFLDGMRGLAAAVVVVCHLTYGTFDIVHAWGGNPDSTGQFTHGGVNQEWLRLPIVRLLYSGPPMVAIFFVISGYALSYKPIKLMHAKSYEALMVTMSSSIFRRGFRLFLPCFASTFLVVCLAQLGLYRRTEDFAMQMRMVREDHCYTQPDAWSQLTDWAQQMLIFVNVFDWSMFAGSVELDRHLWTIPVEVRCSLALFLTQVMLSRMSLRLRVLTLTALITWGVTWNRWEMCPFWAGAVLAELDILRNLKTSILPSASAIDPPRQKALVTFLYTLTFVASLFLLSYPDAAGHATPGYMRLTNLIPASFTEKHRFWPTVGAVLIVWSSCRLSFLRQRAFCWMPVQYLGKISFPLYVMHGPVIHTLGYLVRCNSLLFPPTSLDLGRFC